MYIGYMGSLPFIVSSHYLRTPANYQTEAAINTQLAFNAAYPVDDINKKIVQPADEHDDR